MEIYTEKEYKIYHNYVATILECNYYVIRPKVKDLNILGYDISEAYTKHKIISIDDFVNTKSKQYSKGNLIDEWLWKYPNIITD